MKILIDGTNTLNKGAELMLYAILEEIERTNPNAEISYNSMGNGYNEINTNLKVKGSLRLKYGFYIGIILSKLNLPYSFFTSFYPRKNVDVLLDASGFRLGDQWNRDKKYLDTLESYYKQQKKNGTKIILLSQALGPFETESGRRTAEIMNNYVDLIFAREEVSYSYVVNAGVDKKKVFVSPDFTNLVKGIRLPELDHLKGKVCIIPNKKMLTHTSLKSNQYISSINILIKTVLENGKQVFLLNHEGEGDFKLCEMINKDFNSELEIITNLNAKQIKEVIKYSYFTFSSRYHGVASSLSQGVPCIATSWSHKYKLLFEDYGLSDQILDVNGSEESIKEMVLAFLDTNKNQTLREHITSKQTELENCSRNMWEKVWKTVK